MLIGFLINHQLIFSMKQYNTSCILPFNITVPKHSQIEKLDSSKYNCQSFYSNCDKICSGIIIFFYFNNDGKLDIYYIVKIRHPFILKKSSVLSIECTEMNWKTSNVYSLCI